MGLPVFGGFIKSKEREGERERETETDPVLNSQHPPCPVSFNKNPSSKFARYAICRLCLHAICLAPLFKPSAANKLAAFRATTCSTFY